MEKCDRCGLELRNCICPRIAAFFVDARNLRTKNITNKWEQWEQIRKKFYYIKGSSPLAKSQ